MASQVDATSPPNGVVAPSPVVRLDVADRVADGLQVLHLVVGNLDAELLLGRHHDLDHGQRVDVQVVGEGLALRDVVRVDPGDLFEDFGQARGDLFASCHFWCFLSMVGNTAYGQRTT
jgi:hypothetical protein